jgi:hypothetical protein
MQQQPGQWQNRQDGMGRQNPMVSYGPNGQPLNATPMGRQDGMGRNQGIAGINPMGGLGGLLAGQQGQPMPQSDLQRLASNAPPSNTPYAGQGITPTPAQNAQGQYLAPNGQPMGIAGITQPQAQVQPQPQQRRYR